MKPNKKRIATLGKLHDAPNLSEWDFTMDELLVEKLLPFIKHVAAEAIGLAIEYDTNVFISADDDSFGKLLFGFPFGSGDDLVYREADLSQIIDGEIENRQNSDGSFNPADAADLIKLAELLADNSRKIRAAIGAEGKAK